MNPSRPRGITALVAFFFFGTAMAGLAAIALLFPRSPLRSVWRLNPDAQSALASMGGWAIVLMLTVSAACGLAALGLARLESWGQRLAVLVLSINLVGDTAGAWLRHDPRTLIGLPIAGAMIAYLCSNGVRRRLHP